MRRATLAAAILVLSLVLAGCGDSDGTVFVVTGPGFVGIDDSSRAAPFLIVDFVDDVGPGTAQIFSDPLSDGDIAFDPVLSVFTVSTNVSPLFFGVDQLNPNLPEFRSFFTFPLDGLTGQPIVPSGAAITRAIVDVVVTEVSFADVVPTFLDLVSYGFRALGAQHYDSPPLHFRTLNFLSSDPGVSSVQIDVTPLMQTAQDLDLFDFQIRFLLSAGGSAARPGTAAPKAERTVRPPGSAAPRPERAPPAPMSRVPGAGRPARSR